MREPTSPTAPLAAFPPQPEEYRSRAGEFYGFVAWSSTYLLFALFILWSFLPDEWIVWSGVSWYPNRYIPLAALSGFQLRSVRPDTGNGHCCFQRGQWSSCSSPTSHISHWPCSQPPPSRTSPPSPVRPILPASLSPPFNRPGQIPAAVSSIQPHLILRTRARRRRCMTYPSHWSTVRCTIEGDGKKVICIYSVWVLSCVHDAMQRSREERKKILEPKEGTPR